MGEETREAHDLPVRKWSPYVIGIDLGTSTSSAAIYSHGTCQLVEIEGKKYSPSALSVTKDGSILVGWPAKSRMLVDPENTVVSIKREMGNFEYRKEFQGIPGETFTPAEISAKILEKIIHSAQESDKINLLGTIRYAVVCVPANFDDNKKKMTLEAAKLADLEVICLLEEPVAAAIAYGFEKDRDQKILVYDLGGGTFDVSVLQVKSATSGNSDYEVLAKEGIPKLGGDDFDQKIMEIVADRFRDKTGLDIFDLQKDQGISRKSLREAQQKLKEQAESAKKDLVDNETVQIMVSNFIKDETGKVYDVDEEISRHEFNESIRDFVLETKKTCEKALESAKLEIDEIDRIILVGGSTRVPLIREMIVEMFNKEPWADVDPDLTVCFGASIYGAFLRAPADPQTFELPELESPNTTIKIQNKVTHFLGIEIEGRKFSKLVDKGEELNDEQPVIVREKQYATQYDDQTEIRVTIYQASDEVEYVDEREPDGQGKTVCLGEFYLSGIPKAARGRERISVCFEVNQQNMLLVTATAVGDDNVKKSLEIQRI